MPRGGESMGASPHRFRFHDAVQAREVLGAEHALVHVLELEDVVRRDLLVLCALTPVATLLGTHVAVWVAAATAITAAAFVAAAIVLRVRRRDVALALILE